MDRGIVGSHHHLPFNNSRAGALYDFLVGEMMNEYNIKIINTYSQTKIK